MPNGPESVSIHLRRPRVAHGRGEFEIVAPDLTASAGDVVAVVGANGTGKSSLVQALLGLHPLAGGSVEFRVSEAGRRATYRFSADGGSLSGDPRRAGRFRNRHIGFLPQAPGLLESLPLADNVALREALRPGPGADRAEVLRLLAAVGLGGLERRRPRDLSGGQRARAGLARALLGGPAILVLDEPTASLDPPAAAWLMGWLPEFARGGGIAIVVCHDIPLIAGVANRFWLAAPTGPGRSQIRLPIPGDPDAPIGPAGRPPEADEPEAPAFEPAAGRGAVVAIAGPRRAAAPAVAGRDRDRECVTRCLIRAMTPPAAAEVDDRSPITPTAGPLPTRLRPGLATTAGFALRENLSGKQAAIRGVVAVLVAAAVATFALLLDLGLGAIEHLSAKTPPDDEFINRVKVTAARKGGGRAPISAAEAGRLRALPGLRGLTLWQDRFGVDFLDAGGRPAGKVRVVSVQAGDPHLEPVAEADRETAPIGLIYAPGGRPFRPDEDDEAGAIVTRSWLRRAYWHLADGQPDPPDPEAIRFVLNGLPRYRGALAGWDGSVRVPVVGVVDHPDRFVAEPEVGVGVPDVFFPDGFLRRLAGWAPALAFVYPSADGRPLAPDHELITRVSIAAPGAPAGWAEAEDVQGAAVAEFFPLRPTAEAGALVLRFDPANRPDQLLTEPEAKRRLARLEALIASKGGRPTVDFAGRIASSSLAPPLPPPPPGQYDLGYLRFRELGAVLPGEAGARAACPDLSFDVRYRSGIDKFQAVRFMVDGVTVVIDAAFALGLLFLVGMLAFLHAAAKTAEVGILRVFGLTARGVWPLFLGQLGVLVLPSCLVGLALARLAARWANEAVAWRLAPPDQGEAVPAVFASCRGDVLAGAGWMLACTSVVLVVCTFLAVRVATRRPIGVSLRSSY
jgi:zinc transport system ATP-binding protein